MRRIANLWNWLPTFRAVAETEHVRNAADRLHVSPSALSRTIRLLEEDLGQPLFDRVGRQLRVNAAGQALLQAVRESMRRIHDATLSMESRVLEGPVRVSAEGTLISAFVVPTLAHIRRAHPGIVPVVETGSLDNPLIALRVGDVDVLLHTTPTTGDGLTSDRLGTSTNGVYCGRGHPLFGIEQIALQEAAQHPFVAPPSEEGRPVEGWPADVRRTVAASVTPLQTGVEVCRSGELLAMFPDVVVARERASGELFRLPIDGLPPVSFYVTHRETLGDGGRTEAFVAAVREVVALAMAQ